MVQGRDLVDRFAEQVRRTDAARKSPALSFKVETENLDCLEDKLRAKLYRLEKLEEKYVEVMDLVGKLYDTWMYAVQQGGSIRSGLGGIVERARDLFEFYVEEVEDDE